MAAPINMTKERTNFLGATDIVLDEIPKRLRLYFVEMWNYKYPEYPWENTPSNGEMFFNGESPTKQRFLCQLKNKSMMNLIRAGNCNDWDPSTLFYALLSSSHKLLPPTRSRRRPPLRTSECVHLLEKTRKHITNTQGARLPDKCFEDLIRDVKDAYEGLDFALDGVNQLESGVFSFNHMQRLVERPNNERLANTIEVDMKDLSEDKSGQSLTVGKLMPEKSVHFELSKRFAAQMEQHDGNCKRLSDSVWLIETDEFCIGRGSNSTAVYIGYHTKLGWVAIKRCFESKASKHEMNFVKKHDFRNQHPNIGTFLDLTEEGSFLYIIMELYELTLDKYLEQNDTTFHEKCKIVLDLLQGIDFLHNHQIVHRDLKPQNILIDLSGNPKIVDFGISREIDLVQTTTYETLTLGSFYWLPPELLQVMGSKSKVKKEGDIFVALMLVFFVFSNGQHPFRNLKETNIFQFYMDVSTCNFQLKLNDPFLHDALLKMFTKREAFDSTPKIISRLDETHRIRSVPDKSCEIYERTRGKRYAILISCTNLLDAARADATVLKPSLENCGFIVEARNNISKAQLLSDKIGNMSDRAEPIAVLSKKIQDDDDENIFIYLHVSTHGYFATDQDDTFLRFEDGDASVKEIVLRLFSIINKPKVHLIFTIEACRDYCPTVSCHDPQLFPQLPFAVFYSTQKFTPTPDSGGLPESFSCPGPFSSALADTIKPAMPLGKIFQKVMERMKETTGGYWLPEADNANDISLYHFVF